MMRKKVKRETDLINFLEESSDANDPLNYGLMEDAEGSVFSSSIVSQDPYPFPRLQRRSRGFFLERNEMSELSLTLKGGEYS